MRKFGLYTLILCVCITFYGCTASAYEKDYQLTRYVDPFIGTGGHGHTFPGAVLPFGMVQLSPDTRTSGWDACSGYYIDDSAILGFSHRHLSGTGMTDFADILFTPFVGELRVEGDTIQQYYPLSFSHDNEVATPGYYKVEFDNKIVAEMTATLRTGFHQYTFPVEESGLIIDMHHNLHEQKTHYAELEIINEHEIRGMRLTEGWSKRDYIYFHAKFDKPFSARLFKDRSYVEAKKLKDEDVRAVLNFENKDVAVKVGISAVDYEGAAKNLAVENPNWNFADVKRNAEEVWEKELSRIVVEGGTEEQKTIFYTGLYHVFIHPSLYSDVDKRYRGQDLKIHQLAEGDYYTIFSLWDTYRAAMPLVSLLEPSLTNEFINSLLLKYQQGGILPMWDIAGCYSGTMIGTHSTSFIADSYTKGIRGYDVDLAYEAMMRSIPYDTTGIIVHHPAIWEWLMTKGKLYNEEYGFIPADKDVIFATSRGLEYAYCDWALAQVAKDMKKTDDYDWLQERGSRYKRYFDSETGFMRALDSTGKFVEPFNPSYSNHMNSPYCEGNAWQWTWFVPHDVQGLIDLMGGKDRFEENLDRLFTTEEKVVGEEASADITGLIGQYAHGNEPSHHIIYFYNYIGKPYKTQELADRIMRTQYKASPDGLSGNEDCGQMSAWYIFNALGFYQMSPGNPTYTLSRPLFDKVTLRLADGKTLLVETINNSDNNKYIESVTVNGKEIAEPFFSHSDISDGGKLVFKMIDKYQ